VTRRQEKLIHKFEEMTGAFQSQRGGGGGADQQAKEISSGRHYRKIRRFCTERVKENKEGKKVQAHN